MTHEELDAIDDKIEKAMAVLCRGAGAEGEYPVPRFVRETFKEAGLMIVPLAPTSDKTP